MKNKRIYVFLALTIFFININNGFSIAAEVSGERDEGEKSRIVGRDSYPDKYKVRVGGLFQTYIHIEQVSDDADKNASTQFLINRARISLSGDIIPERVKYFLQGDGAKERFLLDLKLIMIYLNGVHIMEEGESLNNDLLLFQFQVML